MTPSERLVAAADLIRDLAAKAADGPWTAVESDHVEHHEYGEMDDETGFLPVLSTTTTALGAYVAAASGAKIGSGCSYCMQGNIGPGNARWIAALSPALGPWLEAALRSAAVDAEEVGADPYMIGLAGVILGKEPGSLSTSWREDRQVIEAVTRGVDTP